MLAKYIQFSNQDVSGAGRVCGKHNHHGQGGVPVMAEWIYR